MAEGLVVGGIAVRIRRDTWSQLESLWMGTRVRMFNNSAFSTERDERYVWEGEAYFINKDEEDSFRAVAIRGTAILVTGELVGGVGVFGYVDIGPVSYKYVLEGGLQALHRTMQLHIESAFGPDEV